MKALRVGLVGCGAISNTYLKNAAKFEEFEIVACTDLIKERAEEQAQKYNVPRTCTPEEIYAADDIDLVLNLTIPAAHTEVSLAAIDAGKHVYTEKPLATNRDDGRKILEAAAAKGVRVGSAPDTFLGGGIQTVRQVIDGGWIGQPVAATGFMFHRGPERFHPEPGFFYQPGAGPLFDMGPYLSALISVLGPVRRVCASAKTTFPERTIATQPHYGDKIPVDTPTHLAGVLDFTENNVCGTFVASFDVWRGEVPFEVYGTEGSVSIPNPNGFDGPVYVRSREKRQMHEVPLTHWRTEESRGLGIADMARAIAEERPHRANGDLALHVLDIMQSYHESSAENRHILLETHCERPEPMPLGLGPATLSLEEYT